MAEIKAGRMPAANLTLLASEDSNVQAKTASVTMNIFSCDANRLDINADVAAAASKQVDDILPLETGCTWLPLKYRPRASLLQKLAAEVISTFILVFGGCGSVMVDAKSNGQVTHVGVSIAFGVVVTTMIYAVGHISGAHMNPAVTIAFATARHFPWSQVPAYIGAQLVGAITSSYALRLILATSVASEGATLHTGSDAQSLALEIVITFILMFVVSAVATDTRAVSISSSSSSHTHSRPNSPLVHQVQKSLSSNHTLHLALAVELRLLLCSSLVPLKIFSKQFRK